MGGGVVLGVGWFWWGLVWGLGVFWEDGFKRDVIGLRDLMKEALKTENGSKWIQSQKMFSDFALQKYNYYFIHLQIFLV